MTDVLRAGGAHAGIDEQLDGTVRGGRIAQQVLEEPAVACVDRDHGQEPDDGAVALGDEVALLVGERERIELDEEAHRRDLLGREPPLDQRIEPVAHGVPGCELADLERAHDDPLRAGTAQLLAQALALAHDGLPVAGRPHRLIADAQRRPLHRILEARLGAKAAHPAVLRLGGRDEARDHIGEPLRRRDRRAGDDPRGPGVDVAHARVVTIDPVMKPGLEDLERGRVPAVALDRRDHAPADLDFFGTHVPGEGSAAGARVR